MLKKTILIILLLLALLLNSSCSALAEQINTFISDRRAVSDMAAENGHLSIYSLVQKVVDSIRTDSETEAMFNSIPSHQRGSLSLDEYQQYIRVLRRGITADISSFSIMTDEEMLSYQEMILEQRPDQRELAEQMQGVWLYFREIGRKEEQFELFIHEDEEGLPSLSSDWIRQSLRLVDLAVLYFDAIDRSDKEALAILLSNEHDAMPSEILQVKAQRIIDFYRNNVSSRTSEFRITHIRIDSIGFEAFGITNPDQTQSVSRIIELRAGEDNRFFIQDVIPDVLNVLDLNVFFDEQYLFQFAETEDGQPLLVRSNHFESIVGEPLVHDDTTCETSGNIQRFTLEYDSLIIKAEGTCFRHSRWEGLVQKIILHDDRCRLGSGLRPGHTLDEVLRRYPFADDSDFQISGRFSGGFVRMKIHMTGDLVEKIELSLSAF